MGWSHHFWQDTCWDHIISSYFNRLFNHSFKHMFPLPFFLFIQGLKNCDTVISNLSWHFPQGLFSNNIVQNLYWFYCVPPIKLILFPFWKISSNSYSEVRNLQTSIKSFYICNEQFLVPGFYHNKSIHRIYDKNFSLELPSYIINK